MIQVWFDPGLDLIESYVTLVLDLIYLYSNLDVPYFIFVPFNPILEFYFCFL